MQDNSLSDFRVPTSDILIDRAQQRVVPERQSRAQTRGIKRSMKKGRRSTHRPLSWLQAFNAQRSNLRREAPIG